MLQIYFQRDRLYVNDLLLPMTDRLSLKQRREAASLMGVFSPPTRVLGEFGKQFTDCDSSSCFTICRIYAKFVAAGLVAENYRGNAGRIKTRKK